MSRIVMILSNPFRPDPRVDQEARTLAARGHQVTIICWDRHGELAGQESRDGIRIVRVQDVKAGFGTGWRLLVRIPRFWRQAVRLAIEAQPDVVHCHDLDVNGGSEEELVRVIARRPAEAVREVLEVRCREMAP